MIVPLLAFSALVVPTAAGDEPAQRQESSKPQRDGGDGGGGAERVELRTDDEVVVAATFSVPRGKVQRAPAALLIHDAGACRDQVEQIGAKLNKEGFAVLELDLRGHGQSASEAVCWTKLDTGAQEKLWAYATRDVDAAARWLAARSEVNAGNLTVVGVRAGGALAVRQAAKNENVRSVVLVQPEPKLYGFDLTRDLSSLGGTPAYIVVSADRQDVGKSMLKAVQSPDKAAVELSVCKAKLDDFLNDKKLTGEISRWAAARAFPKRGEPR